jgi:hypothetical protein
VTHRSNYADNQKLIELIDAIGEARNNRAQDFQDDDDEEDVINACLLYTSDAADEC